MSLEEFYRLMESNTYLTRNELENLTISELEIIVKTTFNKKLVITMI